MKAKILFSILALTFAFTQSSDAAVSCNGTYKSSKQKTFSLNRLSTQILNGYLQMDSQQLKQALLDAGISQGDLTSRPIYRGGSEPTNIRINAVQSNGTLMLSSELEVATSYGKPLATLQLITEVPKKNLESGQTLVSNKTQVRVLSSNELNRGNGLSVDRLQTDLRNAFLQVDQSSLKNSLRNQSVSQELLRHDLILRGTSEFTQLRLEKFQTSAAGFQNARVSGTIEVYTYYGEFVATVRMSTTVLANKNVQDTAFEILK